MGGATDAENGSPICVRFRAFRQCLRDRQGDAGRPAAWVEARDGREAVRAEGSPVSLFCTDRVAVNHGGDSDNTGSIAGNVIGLIHGQGRIPEDCLTQLSCATSASGFARDL
jgi:hypothetical protein